VAISVDSEGSKEKSLGVKAVAVESRGLRTARSRAAVTDTANLGSTDDWGRR
jgi:hypothetical protein